MFNYSKSDQNEPRSERTRTQGKSFTRERALG